MVATEDHKNAVALLLDSAQNKKKREDGKNMDSTNS